MWLIGHRFTGVFATCIGLWLIASGCKNYSLAQVDRADFYIREDGRQQKVHVANVQVITFGAFLKHNILLVNELPDPKKWWGLSSLVGNTPPWRNLETVYYAGDAMLSDRRSDDAQGITRWVIGNHPLII